MSDKSWTDYTWFNLMQYGEKFRHLKRGSIYVKVGVAGLQCTSPVVEGVPMVVYKSIEDGRLWVRPEEEFLDGRFEKIDD